MAPASGPTYARGALSGALSLAEEILPPMMRRSALPVSPPPTPFPSCPHRPPPSPPPPCRRHRRRRHVVVVVVVTSFSSGLSSSSLSSSCMLGALRSFNFRAVNTRGKHYQCKGLQLNCNLILPLIFGLKPRCLETTGAPRQLRPDLTGTAAGSST